MGALEWFDSSVLSHVSCELIRACKFPCAAFPRALVRFFSSMGPLVGLEVRALGVDLVAARIAATVDSLVPLWLGIVIDSVYKIIGIVGSHSRCHKVRETHVLLHRRRGVGVHAGVMIQGNGGRVHLSSIGCLGVYLSVDVDVHLRV